MLPSKIIFIYCIFFISFFQISLAQETLSIDDVLTNSIPNKKNHPKKKSILLAVMGSILLPGLGNWYLGNKKVAIYYFSTDAFILFSLSISLFIKDSQLQNVYSIGSRYGNINLKNKDNDFLRKITQFRAYLHENNRNDSYEYSQNLQGITPPNFSIPNHPNNYWDFGPASNFENTQNWNKFIRSFQNYERTKKFVSWSIGGLVLLRAFSVIHTIHNYKQRFREETLTKTRIIPFFSSNKLGMSIVSSF